VTAIGSIAKTSSPVLEISAVRSDASEIPVDVSLSLLTIASETFAISVIRDATERVRAEELKRSATILRESEERFRLVADTAPVLIWMSGANKLCTYFNKPWLDFTGRFMDSELGNGWAEGVNPEDLGRCMDTYTQAFDRREPFRMEYRLRRHDGEYRWVLDIGVPRFSEDRSFVGYIGSCVDVTDRKRAEDALRESEARFRLAAQAGKMYAYEWDVATDATMRSEEYANILGLTGVLRSDTRQQFLSRVHPDDRAKFIAAVADLTPENPTTQISYRVLRPDGAVIWLEKSGRAFFDAQGKMLRMIGIVADITERKLAEEVLASVSRRLIEAQEQERTRIARELHDDIGQRLALLTIELEQLQQNSPDLPAEVRSRMGELRKQSSEIATDIQSLSHELHSSRLEYVGIAAAMRGFCQDFRKQQKVEIDFKVHDLPSPLSPDIALCRFRVLQEALHNSAKHSGVRRFEVQLWGMSGEIHLTVSDSGSGFNREAAKVSRGLGLISMEERLKLLDGTFSIESQPKRGTRIHAYVPLRSESDSMRAAG
jgi:PAS domain S-box-containing protein